MDYINKEQNMKRLSLIVSLIAIAALSLSACGANISINLFTADEVVSQSFTGNAQTRIVVEMFNGNIDVITGNDSTIKIDVDKRGGGNSQEAAQADLKNVIVKMTQTGDTINVVANRSDKQVDIGNSGASASLRVPNGTQIELHTGNGKITLSGPVGNVVATTSNGGIEVKGAAGALNLTTSNGGITVNGGSGQLILETSNGGIDVTADNVVIAARSSNGSITFKGSLAAGNQSFRTDNSSLMLNLPAGTSFSVNADTSNGKITSDFKVTSNSSSDTLLQGSVGGNPQISIGLHTSNGNIDIKQSK
jgi:Putative adhesin